MHFIAASNTGYPSNTGTGTLVILPSNTGYLCITLLHFLISHSTNVSDPSGQRWNKQINNKNDY